MQSQYQLSQEKNELQILFDKASFIFNAAKKELDSVGSKMLRLDLLKYAAKHPTVTKFYASFNTEGSDEGGSYDFVSINDDCDDINDETYDIFELNEIANNYSLDTWSMLFPNISWSSSTFTVEELKELYNVRNHK